MNHRARGAPTEEESMVFEGEIREGAEVYGSDGHRIGTVEQVFVLEGTDRPTWMAVRTGLFGMHESFVPIEGARMRGDEIVVAHEKGFVKDAPRIAGSDDLTVEQEAELYRYYGVEPPRRAGGAPGAGTPGAGAPGAGAAPTSGTSRIDDQPVDERGGAPTQDGAVPNPAAPDRATRGDAAHSTYAVPGRAGVDETGAGRAAAHHADGAQTDAGGAGAGGTPRLRRRIVTEMQTIQVPVQREEIVVEGEGIEPDEPRR
jgi:sporulation protein YlmC with PRC-barrel domain